MAARPLNAEELQKVVNHLSEGNTKEDLIRWLLEEMRCNGGDERPREIYEEALEAEQKGEA